MARSTFGSVQTLKGGYRGRYRLRGHTYYTPARATKRGVREDLAAIQAAISDGTWSPPAPRRSDATHLPSRGPLFLSEYADQWLAAIEGTHSPNTLRSYSSHTHAHIKPALGAVRLRDITEDHVAEFMAGLARAGLSGRTQTNIRRSLSALLHHAHAAKQLREMPAFPQAGPARGVAKARGRAPIALTASELGRLMDAAPPEFRAVIALASWCQMRSGEIRALPTANIDTEAWTFLVEVAAKGAGPGAAIGGPKSDAGIRDGSIPAPAREAITYHLEHVADRSPGGLFLPGFRVRSEVRSDKSLLRGLRRACVVAGLPEMRFHDLRHTGLTLYGLAGATMADLMRRAGHADSRTVMIYQHSSRERDRELAERMARL